MFYHKLGKLPRKRHTVFRRPDGQLYHEHLMGNKGFTGPATLMYHTRRPTSLLASRTLKERRIEADPDSTLRMRHFRLAELPAAKSPVLDRTPLLFNADVTLWIVHSTASDDFFYRNGQADELVYVSEGEGTLESTMGELAYRAGDYLVIPRGIVHRYRPAGAMRLLVVEGGGNIRPPRRYRNESGQLVEHAPYCERDIRPPESLVVHDEPGEFRIVVKKGPIYTETVLDHHPCDVVGWDGCYYPFALSIHDFMPIVGALHQPPPVHQTFESDGFVVCSFVPRLFDFYPDAVPVPYNHSNAMSDEVIYYANHEFMSRKGIGYGSLTLHPDGIPHGPHPGRVEASLGKKRTDELAVMVDTFRALQVAREALPSEDPTYARSWLAEA